MRSDTTSEQWLDLVEGLQQLEKYFPLLDEVDEQDSLDDEIEDLEQLIATAGEPEDEHSMRALSFLQSELAHKRALLDDRN